MPYLEFFKLASLSLTGSEHFKKIVSQNTKFWLWKGKMAATKHEEREKKNF